jgi:hypothetical protein
MQARTAFGPSASPRPPRPGHGLLVDMGVDALTKREGGRRLPIPAPTMRTHGAPAPSLSHAVKEGAEGDLACA